MILYTWVIFILQNINNELAEALEEKEQMKEQVQDYIMEVKRIEELLAAKVCCML